MGSKKIFTVITFLFAICLLASASWAGTKLKTAPGARSGLIQTNKHIYCLNSDSPADLELAVVLPKSLDPVWTGEADAWLVIWMPDAEGDPVYLATVNLTGEDWVPDQPKQLLTIKGSDLPEVLPLGEYQIGLVLTKKAQDPAAEDPTIVEQWYGGFSGLVSVSRLVITDDPEVCGETVGPDGFSQM